jgi:hypothetical protein
LLGSLIKGVNLLGWRWQGVELANKDGMFGKSDPFLKLLAVPKGEKPAEESVDAAGGKSKKDSKPKAVYTEEVCKTEVINNDLNPKWKEFEVDMDKLTPGITGDAMLDTKFMIECWDKDTVTKDDEIGWMETTVRQLITMHVTKQPLVLIDRPGGRTDKPGSLIIDRIQMELKPLTPAAAALPENKQVCDHAGSAATSTPP